MKPDFRAEVFNALRLRWQGVGLGQIVALARSLSEVGEARWLPDNTWHRWCFFRAIECADECSELSVIDAYNEMLTLFASPAGESSEPKPAGGGFV